MYFHSSVKKIYGFIFTVLFITLIFAKNFIPSAQAQNQSHVSLERFDMLTATAGWVLLGQQLFWTYDAGQTWNEIGPSIPLDALIPDVDFIDADTAWMLWITINPDSSSL